MWSDMHPDIKVHGANMGPIGVDRAQVGTMLPPLTLPPGFFSVNRVFFNSENGFVPIQHQAITWANADQTLTQIQKYICQEISFE